MTYVKFIKIIMFVGIIFYSHTNQATEDNRQQNPERNNVSAKVEFNCSNKDITYEPSYRKVTTGPCNGSVSVSLPQDSLVKSALGWLTSLFETEPKPF